MGRQDSATVNSSVASPPAISTIRLSRTRSLSTQASAVPPKGPRTASRAYFHFCVNAAGAIYDSYKGPDADGVGDPSWNSGAVVKTTSNENGWRLEMAVPVRSLKGFRSAGGAAFAVNFCRHMSFDGPARAEYSSWAKLAPGQNFHVPEAFQKAVDMLKGKDPYCMGYVTYCRMNGLAG